MQAVQSHQCQCQACEARWSSVFAIRWGRIIHESFSYTLSVGHSFTTSCFSLSGNSLTSILPLLHPECHSLPEPNLLPGQLSHGAVGMQGGRVHWISMAFESVSFNSSHKNVVESFYGAFSPFRECDSQCWGELFLKVQQIILFFYWKYVTFVLLFITWTCSLASRSLYW